MAYDPAQRPTAYSNYKRGLAQLITYPDSRFERAVVNDIGPDHVAHQRGQHHHGLRLRQHGAAQPDHAARRRPGAGQRHPRCASSRSYAAEAGLASGHWRQTVVTGNGVTLNYFDALWRLVLSRSYDAADMANTNRSVLKRYDAEGRKVFESYPSRTISSTGDAATGTAWLYDALGRVYRQTQDSELGPLVTITEYLAGFQRPRHQPARALHDVCVPGLRHRPARTRSR